MEAATAALRAVERPAPSQFEFCDDRRAWDAIFDDALMCEFVTLLGTLPQARRIETRRKVLETVTGGVLRAGSAGILDSVGDLDAARAPVSNKRYPNCAPPSARRRRRPQREPGRKPYSTETPGWLGPSRPWRNAASGHLPDRLLRSAVGRQHDQQLRERR
ncbi:MAG: hypothetical protein R3D43_13625 [Tepidamorphaceae bacterium]